MAKNPNPNPNLGTLEGQEKQHAALEKSRRSPLRPGTRPDGVAGKAAQAEALRKPAAVPPGLEDPTATRRRLRGSGDPRVIERSSRRPKGSR